MLVARILGVGHRVDRRVVKVVYLLTLLGLHEPVERQERRHGRLRHHEHVQRRRSNFHRFRTVRQYGPIDISDLSTRFIGHLRGVRSYTHGRIGLPGNRNFPVCIDTDCRRWVPHFHR